MSNLLKFIRQINADWPVAYLSSRFILIVLGSSQLSTQWKGASPHSFLQHSGMHSCSTALRQLKDAQGNVHGHSTGQGLPAAPLPLDKNMLSSLWSLKFGAFQRCAWHMEASTAPFLLFEETNLGDDKCARWTSFAWRNLRSSSLSWCHKQLKAETSKKITHVFTDLFIPSFYLHPLP